MNISVKRRRPNGRLDFKAGLLKRLLGLPVCLIIITGNISDINQKAKSRALY
jgi:hypothetical protein